MTATLRIRRKQPVAHRFMVLVLCDDADMCPVGIPVNLPHRPISGEKISLRTEVPMKHAAVGLFVDGELERRYVIASGGIPVLPVDVVVVSIR